MKEINDKVLKIPEQYVDEHRELFLNDKKRQQHLMASKWILQGGTVLNKELDRRAEYNANKIEHLDYKLVYLNKFMVECGINSKLDLVAKHGLEGKKAVKRLSQFRDLIRVRMSTKKGEKKEKKVEAKTWDFTKVEDCSLAIEKIYVDCFGRTFTLPYTSTQAQVDAGYTMMTHIKLQLFTTKRKTVNKVKYTVNTINPHYFEYHLSIAKYRNPGCRTQDLQFGFGDEESNKELECLIED